MDRKPITNSSNIVAISDRDPETGDFEIEFRAGSVYLHKNVPQEIYSGLMAAKSKGSYYFEHLKGRYGVAKVGT